MISLMFGNTPEKSQFEVELDMGTPSSRAPAAAVGVMALNPKIRERDTAVS